MNGQTRDGESRKAVTRHNGIDRSLTKPPGSQPAISGSPAALMSPTGSRLVSLRHHPSLWVGTVALLVVALLPWSYGYYAFLRLVVFAVSVWIGYEQWKHDDAVSGWVVAFGAVALLYNPLLPVHLTREIWTVLNLATAMLFLWHFRELGRLVARLSRSSTPMSDHSVVGHSRHPHRSPDEHLPRN